MKFLKILFTLILTVAIGHLTFAQNSSSQWCGTDQALEEYFQQNPQERLKYENEMMRFARQMPNVQINKSNHKLIVPVVVHVIHNNGQGDISKAQIDDAIRVINEDFNKLNADTSAVRSVFSSLIEDMEIEFRLAKKDPNGNCTEGLTRTNNPSASLAPSNRNLPKSVIRWNTSMYLNIWVVNSISGGGNNTLGFAQFPSSSQPASTYGIVIRADQMGGIGLASSTDGRTLTHEVGHCLNLYHTFQSGCGFSCTSSGDFVCDTPPQSGSHSNSCNFTINSCNNDATGGSGGNPNPYSSNVPDQLENYMGYGLSCMGMFTPGQKNRVYAAFNTYALMTSLIDSANLVLTGTNDGYVAQTCVPNILVNDPEKYLCAGSQATFTDDSWGGPLTNYSWSFPGGTPSSDTSATPTITYNTPGTYDVILRISNAGGIDSLILNNYVNVGDTVGTYSAYNYTEGFENSTTFNNDWTILSPDGTSQRWGLIGTGSGSSSSAWINNLGITQSGAVNQLISPSMDMTQVSSPALSFDVGYKRKSSNSNDRLIIKGSINCGETWGVLVNLPHSFIAYDVSTSTSNYVPTQANQWKPISLPSSVFTSAMKNSNNFKLMFELQNGDGNNVFLDNIAIGGQPVGLGKTGGVKTNSFTTFPNPANEKVNVSIEVVENSKQAEMYISNILGKRVKDVYKGSLKQNGYNFTVDLSELSSGIYFVTLQTENGRKTQKLVVK
jgi:hypothetical protein